MASTKAIGELSVKVNLDIQPMMMDARSVMATFADGNDHGWHNELQFCWFEDRERTLALLDEVGNIGRITEPVHIGVDGRVWDGHHRIAVALALSLPVPVTYMKREAE